MDLDGRAIGDKAGDRRRFERVDESRAVKSGDVRFELRRLGLPQPPARMFHSIFAATIPPGGITPVMFGDKFLVRTIPRTLGFAGRGHGERFPTPAPTPLVFGE